MPHDSSSVRVVFAIALLMATACRSAPPTPSAPSTTIIKSVVLLDGSGAQGRRGAVRIAGADIVAVGADDELRPRAGETVIDGRGLTLAPGFIDTHSHADRALTSGSDALGALSQGITTVVLGQDGSSPYPLAAFFSRLSSGGVPINVAAYAGHGTLRRRVMGDDFKRHARPDEIARMDSMLTQELGAGALGLSTGLEYDPGIYSSHEEVVALARRAAAAGGRYISHIRSEDRAFWAAVEEIVDIGRTARLPVQISHVKLAMKSLWGRGDSLVAVLDAARASGVDVTADIYPYRYWQSGLTVLFPERNFDDRAAADFALDQVSPPDEITLTRYDPNPAYAGKTLSAIARERREEPAVTLMGLIKDAEAAERSGRPSGETIIAASMVEPDIERLIAWPHANICTDGELDGRHPRGFGSFPRVLGHYVRDRGVVSLSEAVRKMTSLAAAHMGIRDRGRIAAGQRADLVLFDPATVIDRATPAAPHEISSGIAKVWVNGILAYEAGHVTGARHGQVLRR